MFARKTFRLKLSRGTLVLGGRALVMGVLNVTPDSFSDGGKFFSVEAAVKRAVEMAKAGADILDIGGESTRPGSDAISAEEEIRRVLPVIQRLRKKLRIPISIDTQKAAVAEAAVKAGAEMINDVSALRADANMACVARRHRLPVILMHMRGEPRTMQKQPFARNVMQDVKRGLRAAVGRTRTAGIAKSQIILDPGIGFGKSYAQTRELLARLPELARLGYPLLVGTSRKAFIGAILGSAKKPWPAEKRLWGTAATVVASILGGAHIVRVHDVNEMAQVARIADAVVTARSKNQER
ncbi:MAG: dihydropteroate synthase [Acidobacteria bacterium]|nr:dihydropteroate synthase [Acidobacteriota bacterium]